MKRHLVILLACIAGFLGAAASAYAASSVYRGPMYWSCYCDGSSSYSSQWWDNYFIKDSNGVSDTMVTLIDNVTYSWHGTVRNTASQQKAWWVSSVVKKGYCKFYSGTAFNGSCLVTS